MHLVLASQVAACSWEVGPDPIFSPRVALQWCKEKITANIQTDIIVIDSWMLWLQFAAHCSCKCQRIESLFANYKLYAVLWMKSYIPFKKRKQRLLLCVYLCIICWYVGLSGETVAMWLLSVEWCQWNDAVTHCTEMKFHQLRWVID